MDSRYRLHDGDLLRRLIDYHRDGEPASVRELADRTGLSKSKVQALVGEDRPTVTEAEAQRIAEAYRLRRRALFSPVSTSMDVDKPPRPRKDAHGHRPHPRGANAPGPHGGAEELGEHRRPGEQDGEGASRGSRPL